MGVYEGDEHRLVGTEQIPLAELTPELVRERVERAACELLGLALDPDAVRDFFARLQAQRSRDTGQNRFRDIDQGESWQGCPPPAVGSNVRHENPSR